MARGAIATRGETINHFNGVRLLVRGAGNLDVNIFGLDDSGDNATNVPIETLISYTMSLSTNREPTLLANARQQRISFKFSLNEINEFLEIERIIVFYKPMFRQFPGRG